MKKNLPETNMQTYSQPSPYYEDEVSLVDIAKILVKRRKVFYAVFLSVFSLGLVYVLVKPTKIEYKTFYNVATLNETPLIEPVKELAKKIEYLYMEQLAKNYKYKTGKELPFKIEVDQKKSDYAGNYITLSSFANDSSEKRKEVSEIHKELLKLVELEQVKLVEERKKTWLRQKAEAQVTLNQLNKVNTPTALEKSTSYIDLISRLDTNLENVKLGYLLELAEPTEGKSKKLIIIGGAFFGGIFLGLILVFFLEFAMAVKKAIEDDNLAQNK